MDLNIKNRKFLVCGATSGFGRAVSENLLREDARIIAVARNLEKLKELEKIKPESVKIFQGDLFEEDSLEELLEIEEMKDLSGALINAGGPPAGKYMEMSIEQWDKAYETVLRWKIMLTNKLIPLFLKNKYGRMVFLESAAVKQPIGNLVLSNSLRMAVVGMVKSLALDLASEGITMNIMAPGYHETQALKRLINKKAEVDGISYEEAKSGISSEVPVGRLGTPKDFGSLAAWLLSEKSGFITGQTISVDGGNIRHVFG